MSTTCCRRAVLPIPASPCSTRTRLCPARTASSSSASRPALLRAPDERSLATVDARTLQRRQVDAPWSRELAVAVRGEERYEGVRKPRSVPAPRPSGRCRRGQASATSSATSSMAAPTMSPALSSPPIARTGMVSGRALRTLVLLPCDADRAVEPEAATQRVGVTEPVDVVRRPPRREASACRPRSRTPRRRRRARVR